MINSKQLNFAHELQFYPIDFNKLKNNNSKTNLIKHLKKMNKFVADEELMLARDEASGKFPTYKLAFDVNEQEVIIGTDDIFDKYNSPVIAFYNDTKINYEQNDDVIHVADDILDNYCTMLFDTLKYEKQIKDSPKGIYNILMNDFSKPILFSPDSYTGWIINQIDKVKGKYIDMLYIYNNCKSLYLYLLLKKLPNCKQFYVSALNLVLHYLRYNLTKNTSNDNRISLLLKITTKIINDNNINLHYDENIDYDCLYEAANILHYENMTAPIESLLLLSVPKLREFNNTKIKLHLDNEKELNGFINQLLVREKYRWDDIDIIMSDIYPNLINHKCIHIGIDANLIQAKIDLIKNNFEDVIMLQKVANVLEIINKSSA